MLSLRERHDVGRHDLEVDQGADGVDRRGRFAAVQMLPGWQEHGVEVLGAPELAPHDARSAW